MDTATHDRLLICELVENWVLWRDARNGIASARLNSMRFMRAVRGGSVVRRHEFGTRRSIVGEFAIECLTEEEPLMVSTNQIAEIGAVIGEPARAAMLSALLDGRALTAAELAQVSRITPQTASGHLARLTAAGLLAMERQGRHRYHRLASPKIAQMLEGIMEIAVARETSRLPTTGPRDATMRFARTCYDHLAGTLGVAITDALVTRDVIVFEGEGGLVTADGEDFLRAREIILPSREMRTARPVCRPCLDWSERRPHVAGQVGTAICRHVLDAGWVRRLPSTRALTVTPHGRAELRRVFGVVLQG
jgi:DNA-binding transcriptional ArsR family regulator